GAEGAAAADPARSVYVVVPYTNTRPGKRAFYPKFGDPNPTYNPEWDFAFDHPYGKTNLFVDNATVQAYTDLGPIASEKQKGGWTRRSVVLGKHAQWQKNRADGQRLLDLVAEALEHGMVPEAVAYADELAAAAEAKKTQATGPVARFLDAYAKIQKPLKDPPAGKGAGDEWAARLAIALGKANQETRGHYTLVYWDAPEADRTRRLVQLEDNLRAFYLWHAVRGVALPVPDRPLTAVLPRTGREAAALARSLDHFPVRSDAFYVPEYDLVVLYPEWWDEVGQTFQRQLQQMYREGVSRAGLLTGSPPPVPIDTTGRTKGAKRPEEVARMMTFALVERYAADATEWQAVSREGTQQLYYASGLLPRHVALPQWLSGGAVGFFGRPRGPVFTTREVGDRDATFATLALTTGYGAPNFVLQKHFAELVGKKQLAADAGTTLRRVVSDTYFAAIGDRIDADDPRLPLPPAPPKKAPAAAPAPGVGPVGLGPVAGPPADVVISPAALERRREEFLVNKAYATAWALYFHLARNHPAELGRYTAELARMPRDLPLDEATRLETFARAFNLTAGPSQEGDRLTFAQFGDQWLKAMEAVPPAGFDIELKDPTPAAAGAGAGVGGRPGGFPGFTGGRPGVGGGDDQ
ncbi:MAG: hypothetical protein K2X82_01550, partial [Gemmataceae bacterium]|nr:hypothetical protein [Gemmataceae bacterium]